MCVFVCVLYTGGFVCSTSISHPHMFCIISLVTNINIIIANINSYHYYDCYSLASSSVCIIFHSEPLFTHYSPKCHLYILAKMQR